MEHWRKNLYIIWLAQIISLTSFGFGLPFLPFYVQQLGVTDPDQLKIYTGILNAAPAVTMGLMAPVWGYLADRYGKKLMLMRSMFFASLILAGMGFAVRAEHLIILRFLQGLFTGTVTASAALIASNTPDNRLSYALGFLSSSTFIGYSVGPVLGGFIAEHVGYRISFFVGAGLMLVGFVLVFFAATEGKRPPYKQTEKRSKQGMFAFKDILTPLITSMLLVLLFMRLSRSIFAPYMPLFVQELQHRMKGAAQTTGIISGITGFMTALSGLTLSRLGDKYDKRMLLRIFISISIFLSLPLSFLNSLWMFTVVYGLLFFAIGGIEPMIMSITSQNVTADRRGMLFGIQALVGSIGWAVSPILGSIVSIQFSTRSVSLLIPAALIFALVTVLLIKPIKKEQGDEAW